MWRTVGTAGFVGVEIILALAVGRLGGQWLDGKLGSTPWLGWIGTVVGIGAAVNALLRVIRGYNKALKQDQDDDPSQPKDR